MDRSMSSVVGRQLKSKKAPTTVDITPSQGQTERVMGTAVRGWD